MAEEPIYQANNLTYHYRLYHNRLEIEVKHFPFPSSKNIIPLRNITEVKRPFGRPMEIHTTDRKKYTINLNGKAANELQAKIMENM